MFPVQEIWGVWKTTLLPLLLFSLWPERVLPVNVPSNGEIDLSKKKKKKKEKKSYLKNNKKCKYKCIV